MRGTGYRYSDAIASRSIVWQPVHDICLPLQTYTFIEFITEDMGLELRELYTTVRDTYEWRQLVGANRDRCQRST